MEMKVVNGGSKLQLRNELLWKVRDDYERCDANGP